MQRLITFALALVGSGVALLVLWWLVFPLNILACVATLFCFGVGIYLGVRNDYGWLELTAHNLRARHSYTLQVKEWPINNIKSLVTMYYAVTNATIAVTEAIFGRVRGVEIQFRDGHLPLRIYRYDPKMTNAREFLEAMMVRMREVQPITAAVWELDGAPFVKCIHFQGEEPTSIKNNHKRVVGVVLTYMALVFGILMGFSAMEEERMFQWSQREAQVIDVKELSERGPGENLHVKVRNFQFGGFAYSAKNNRWEYVEAAVFPALNARGVPPGPPNMPGKPRIEVVLSSQAIFSDEDLVQLSNRNELDGICSAQRKSYGTSTVSRELRNSNPDYELSQAWEIKLLPKRLPTATTVRLTYIGSLLCLLVSMASISYAWLLA